MTSSVDVINVIEDLSQYITFEVVRGSVSTTRGKLTETGADLFRQHDKRNFQTDQIVAIKKIVLKTPDDTDLKKRILELKQMDLKGSVHYYGCFSNKDIAWIVMSLVEGKRLQQLIDENTLTYDQKHIIAERLASSIEECHKKNVTHGEIKPANIMVKFNSKESNQIDVILVDFGLPTTCCNLSITEPGYTYLTGKHFLDTKTQRDEEKAEALSKGRDYRKYNPEKIVLLKKSDWWAYGQVMVYMYLGIKMFEKLKYDIQTVEMTREQSEHVNNRIKTILGEKHKLLSINSGPKIPEKFQTILLLLTTTNNHPNLIPESISIRNSLPLVK
jgi:serine/threonine protein kinase